MPFTHDLGEFDYERDVNRLLELVKEKHPNAEELRKVDKGALIFDKVFKEYQPICRITIDHEDAPGVVDYFLIASFRNDDFVYYRSDNW